MAELAMNHLDNNRGVALVTALLLTMISLGITMALLSFILAGTKMSASQKRYRNALSAAYGGVEITTKDLIPRIFKGYSSGSDNNSNSFSNKLVIPVTNACLRQKLNLPTAQWTECGPNAYVPDASISPDFAFTLKGMNSNADFNMKAKIVDTVPGNSDPSGMELDPAMAVAGSSAGISPMHLPAMVTLEVEGTQGNNSQEKADLSVLYAY
jgi:hypothetical protein